MAGSGRFYVIDGLIDEVAIYDKALSDEEMLNSYCATLALAGTDPLPDNCLCIRFRL